MQDLRLLVLHFVVFCLRLNLFEAGTGAHALRQCISQRRGVALSPELSELHFYTGDVDVRIWPH